MIGLLDGIRGGSADARAAQQLELQRQDAAMRQQEFGLRRREMEARLSEQERQRRLNDELVSSIDSLGVDSGAAPAGLRVPPQQMGDPGAAEPVAPAAGLAPPGTPSLTKLDRAAMRAAAGSGDIKGVYGIKDRMKAEGQDASRKSEFKRLMGMSEQDLVAAFEPMNAHPGFKGMLNFDPKSRKFLLVSQIPGLETQSLSKEELVQSMMGIWESGNGDFKTGMKMMMDGAQRRRDIDNSNFDRSGKLAGMNADAHFKGADDDRMAGQAAEQARHNRAMEARASAAAGRAPAELSPETRKALMELEQKWIQADPKDRPAIERQYQLLQSRAGYELRRPMGLPSKGPRGTEISEKDLNDQAIKLVEMSGGKLSLAGAKAQLSGSYDPDAAFGAALDKIAREKEAKNGARGGAPSSAGAGLTKPPGAPADYGRYGAPGYQTYMQDMALQQWLQAQQGQGGLGLSMPQLPVDFSKYNTPR